VLEVDRRYADLDLGLADISIAVLARKLGTFPEGELYTGSAHTCSIGSMERSPHRLNVTLDGERAAKLAQLSERTNVQEGTLARSLLSGALDEADADARNVAALLDGLPGAYERAQLGLEQAEAGDTIPLDDL